MALALTIYEGDSIMIGDDIEVYVSKAWDGKNDSGDDRTSTGHDPSKANLATDPGRETGMGEDVSDKARRSDTLDSWCKRNGIDLGEATPEIVGYWCRVSGVSLAEESIRRRYDDCDSKASEDGWREADAEILAESLD